MTEKSPRIMRCQKTWGDPNQKAASCVIVAGALVDVSVGESADLVSFCRAEWPRLVGTLSLYTGDGLLAEDLAQESLARACRDWHKVRRLDAPEAWLHRVAINLANSHFRRWAAWRRARVRVEGAARLTVPDPDPAAALAVRSAVAALPKPLREVLVLRYFADLSVREVAEVTGRPEGSVKRLTSEAIDCLRAAGLIELRKPAADAH